MRLVEIVPGTIKPFLHEIQRRVAIRLHIPTHLTAR